MITKMTPQNELQYQKLFREAEEVLKLHEDYPTEEQFKEDESLLEKWTIGDIYTYFIGFPRILEAARIKDENTETKVPGDNLYWQKYFSILPLDEPVFSINANTRIISIPSEFKNIGVVGDNTAEIIFFEIDRFFDAVDFGAEQIKAVIEWYRVGKSDEIHADEAYIKELTLKKDKVLIGWVIDKEITEEAGAIEFSLRLYIEKINEDNPEEREIIYSFSTSPAKVNIGKTLNFYGQDLNTIDTNKSSEVLNRILQTASPDLSNENTIASPSFTRVEGNEPDITIISTNIDSITSNVYTKAENAYYVDFNEDTNNDSINDSITINGVTARSMSGNNASRLKYQWKQYNNGTWLRYPAGSAPAIADKENGAVVTIKDTGKYKCEVSDNVGIRFGIADSQILYVLEPEEPKVFNNEEPIPVILKENDGVGVDLVVKSVNNDNEYYDSANGINDLTFLWKSDLNSNDILKEDILNSYNVKQEGYYYGYAKTTRNLKSKVSSSSTKYRVTEELKDPRDYYTIGGNLQFPSIPQGQVGQTIVIDFNRYDKEWNDPTKICIDSYKYDNLSYVWCFSDKPFPSKVDDFTKIIESGKIAKGESIVFKTPDLEGNYILKLYVEYNGQILPDTQKDDNMTWAPLKQIKDGQESLLIIGIMKD